MNRESKKLFRTTFETVNAKFKALFPKMFRGGQAELRLTNPEDMLETDVAAFQIPDVTHHLGFRMMRVEHRMGQKY